MLRHMLLTTAAVSAETRTQANDARSRAPVKISLDAAPGIVEKQANAKAARRSTKISSADEVVESMRVLLVEDDRMIGAAVVEALKDAAYAVDWVQDGQLATEAIRSETYEIALLDLGLPFIDGLDVLKKIRSSSRVPVIILTARDALTDRIRGLDLGADDYLVKPFEVGELLARMRAVMRREGSGASPILGNGKLQLDPATREASYLGERSVLSAREFALLQALLARPGNQDAMLALLFDYRTNPPKYPAWHAYFRAHRPPTLITWGKNDVIFPAPGAPVSPITRARPLCGNNAFSRSDHPATRFSTIEMARARALASPERTSEIKFE